jgi:hypothetical protein
MLKKMMLLALSVGALLAFAAPVAQGQELYELDGEEHVSLGVGAKVTATSTNLVTTLTATGSEVQCAHVTIHGEVTENGATGSKIGNNTISHKECNTAVSNPSVGGITISPNTTGVAHSWTRLSGPCDFTGNIPFIYATNSDTLTVTTDPVTNDQLFSPICGHAKTTGSFTLETNDGTPVFIS